MSEVWEQMLSNYIGADYWAMLAYCEIELTDLDILSELKTRTQH